MRGIELLRYNAPAYKLPLVHDYLAEENTETLPHPAYSPDLALCDFCLFPHPKTCLAGSSFKSRSALGTAVFQHPVRISTEAYRSAFLHWPGRLEHCVAIEEYLLSLSKEFPGW